jgi:ABC-type transport system substrate-binding protein
MRSIPDATTRALTLKTGEADIAYALDGLAAEGIKDDPSLKIVPTKHASINWIEFPEQWDPKSPWHDERLRLAVNYALDRQAISEAGCLGFCPPAGVIVPRVMDFALHAQPMPYDPAKAKQLLAEAGYPNGIDAGEFTPIPGFPTIAEGVMNYLNAAGIRVRLKQMERAAFYADWQAKKLHGLFLTGAGNSGNAASRVEAFMQSKGAYAYGGYPDIDELFRQQATERDHAKREALLDKIQQLTIDRVMYAPVMDFSALMGIGPRITKHTIGDVWMSPFPSYEDLEIKG